MCNAHTVQTDRSADHTHRQNYWTHREHPFVASSRAIRQRRASDCQFCPSDWSDQQRWATPTDEQSLYSRPHFQTAFLEFIWRAIQEKSMLHTFNEMIDAIFCLFFLVFFVQFCDSLISDSAASWTCVRREAKPNIYCTSACECMKMTGHNLKKFLFRRVSPPSPPLPTSI